MEKINNYYEVQYSTYNFVPCELIEIKDENIFVFQNLINKNVFSTRERRFREVQLSQVHFDRLGFINQQLNGLWSVPASFILGVDLQNLALANYGYLLFQEEQLDNVQKRYSEFTTKINELYKENKESIYNSKIFKDELESISTVNELFDRLENYGVVVDDKINIITGS